MSDFLVVVGDGPLARRWWQQGLRIAAELGFGAPSAELIRDGVAAAAFGRRRSQGTALAARDDGGAHWLLAAGSWFRPGGLRPGREDDLLDLVARAGIADVARQTDGFFVLVDGDGRRCRVATDAIGSHHVHARRGDGATAIAGSALWLAALDDSELDPVGCQEMLTTGVIYEDRTPWLAVRALPAASVVEFDADASRTLAQHSPIAAALPFALDGEAAVEAFGSAMTAACERVGAAFERPVSDLTGGWDSRLLCAFLIRAGLPFETTVTGDERSPDVRISQRIATVTGVAHHVLPLRTMPTADEVFDAAALTDGLVNAIGYARVLRVHRELAPRFSASLNGSFGELARGYWWELLQPGADAIGELDAAKIAEQRYAAGASAWPLWPTESRLEPVAHFRDLVARTDRVLDGQVPLGLRLDAVYLRLRMRSWQGRIASATDRLWPALSPMIARDVLGATLSTRPAMRARDHLARAVLARYAPLLARLPLERGGPAMPRRIGNCWRFTPELLRFARRAAAKLVGRSGRTLEETAAPRLALWRSDRIRDTLDADRMVLGDHVDRRELGRLLERMRADTLARELDFGNLLALEIALRRARELRVGV